MTLGHVGKNLVIPRTVWGLRGIRTERPVRPEGERMVTRTKLLVVKTKRSKGGRDPQGKDKFQRLQS